MLNKTEPVFGVQNYLRKYSIQFSFALKSQIIKQITKARPLTIFSYYNKLRTFELYLPEHANLKNVERSRPYEGLNGLNRWSCNGPKIQLSGPKIEKLSTFVSRKKETLAHFFFSQGLPFCNCQDLLLRMLCPFSLANGTD